MQLDMIDSKIENHLKTLELTPSASWEDIQSSYRELIKVWHPDRYTHDEKLKARAEVKTKLLIEAFHSLKPHYRKTELIGKSLINLSKLIVNQKKDVNINVNYTKSSKQYVVNQNLSIKKVSTENCMHFLEKKHEAETKFARYMGFVAACSFFGLIGAIGFPDSDLVQQKNKQFNFTPVQITAENSLNKYELELIKNNLNEKTSKVKKLQVLTNKKNSK